MIISLCLSIKQHTQKTDRVIHPGEATILERGKTNYAKQLFSESWHSTIDTNVVNACLYFFVSRVFEFEKKGELGHNEDPFFSLVKVQRTDTTEKTLRFGILFKKTILYISSSVYVKNRTFAKKLLRRRAQLSNYDILYRLIY